MIPAEGKGFIDRYMDFRYSFQHILHQRFNENMDVGKELACVALYKEYMGGRL